MECKCNPKRVVCTCNAHPHAEQMAQYAEDAECSKNPWKGWEFLVINTWLPLCSQPRWDKDTKYRRSPVTPTVPKMYMNLYESGTIVGYPSIQAATTALAKATSPVVGTFEAVAIK